MLNRTVIAVSYGAMSGIRRSGSKLSSSVALASPLADLTDLQDDNTVILDCSQQSQFDRAHVAGARPFAFPALKAAGSRHVVSKGELEALVAQTGIRNDSNVVVYDDVGGVSAARVWWVLSYYGFPSVRVLRCGWSGAVAMAAKLATGPAVWDETAVSDPGYFHASPQDDLLATADDALAASTDPETQLLDVRTAAEYAGIDLRGNARAGHIPTAINLPYSDLVSDGRFVAVDKARQVFEGLGLDPSKRVIAYCQSGGRAAHTALMLRAAGFDKAANFDGSMAVYANDTDNELAVAARR